MTPMDNSLNLPPLDDHEKAIYDTLKQVFTGSRPEDVALQRMAFVNEQGEDPRPVAMLSQRIIDKETAETVGWQPLAMLVNEELILALRAPDGGAPSTVSPDDVEGAGGP